MEKRKVLHEVAFLLLALSFNFASVLSQPTTDDGSGGDSPTMHNPVSVLAVYDEEMASGSFFWKDRWVNGETYIMYQLRRAFYHFPFTLKISGYEQWNSDNSEQRLSWRLLEVVTELHWSPGSYRSGVRYDLLIALTAQASDIVGVASVSRGATIVSVQDWCPDDNVLIHETGHLFGLHACSEHCVMNEEGGQHWWWYDEPLAPIESGVVTFFLNRWEYYCFMAYEWCDPHYEMLHNYFSGKTTLASLWLDESLPDTSDSQRWNPPITQRWNTHPSANWVIVAIAVILIGTASIIYLKRITNRKKSWRRESAP